MASLLSFPIKKEDDIVPLPSIHPKRKPAIVSIPPRARFAKARPNIRVGATKAKKDAQPPEIEFENIVAKVEIKEEEEKVNAFSNSNSDVLRNDDVETKEDKDVKIIEDLNSTSITKALTPEKQTDIAIVPALKKEPEFIQKPFVAPKRSVGLPIAPRARYQKARPNIAALANKTPKENTQKGSSPASGNAKDSAETTKQKLIPQDDSAKEPVEDLDSNKAQSKEKSAVPGFCFTLGVVEALPDSSTIEPVVSNSISPDVPTKKHLDENQDVLTTDSQLVSSENNSNSPVFEDDTLLNEDEELALFGVSTQKLETVEKQQANVLSNKKSKPVCQPVEYNEPVVTIPVNPPTPVPPPTPTPSVHKPMEYPTLKSILNSPRKRTTTKKIYERKRRLANLSEKPSRSEMTMTDLIYYNPAGEPMKSSKPQTCPVENLLPADENTKPIEEEPEEDETSTPVPKVIINENGEIIIDESSLVVRRKETVDTSVEAIIENDNTTYSSFRKRSSKQWTNRETSKFYKALSLVGSDFALMENIFTVDGKVTRSRRELKLKFKREEKLRIELVHRAMYETQTYDVSILQEEDLDDLITAECVDDAPKVPKKRGRKPKEEGNQTKPTARKKKKKTFENGSIVDENEEDAIYSIMENDSNGVNPEAMEGDLNDQASKSEVSRPQRVRKTRNLSDFVTDVEDSDNSEDYLPDSVCEPKKKIVETRPESQTEVLESINENGESILIEKPPKVRKRKQVLSTDNSEQPNIDLPVPTEVTRLGRIRKLKVLPDYVTDDVDSEEACDSEEESVVGVGKRRKVQALSESGDEEYLVENGAEFTLKDQTIYKELITKDESRIGNINPMPQVPQREIISKVAEDSQIVIPQLASNDDQDIVCVSVNKPSKVQDFINLENSQRTDRTSTTDQSSTTNNVSSPNATNKQDSPNDDTSPTAVISSKDIGNLLQFPYLPQQHSSNSVENLLTDAEISEVITTNWKTTIPRRPRRRAAMPNLTRGKQRPRPEVEKPQVQPSFSNFTPTEENITPDKVVRTYSRNSRRQLPSRLETSVDGTCQETSSSDSWSSQNDQTTRQGIQPAVTLNQTLSPDQTETSVEGIETITLDSQNDLNCDTETPLQGNLSGGSLLQSSNLLSGTSYQTAYQNVPSTNDNSMDPPPVMIFTKSPNNENILHLFVMKSPDHNF